MHILITRHRYKPATIDGQLSIDGIRICDCAENAHTALPPGTYPIAIVPCRQYARKMPVINDNDNTKFPSPNAIAKKTSLSLCSSCHRKPFVGINTKLPRVCPMLKPGNGVYNRTDGSIIVGEYIVPGCLKHPKTAFDNLYDRIRKNIERGNPVTLTIR